MKPMAMQSSAMASPQENNLGPSKHGAYGCDRSRSYPNRTLRGAQRDWKAIQRHERQYGSHSDKTELRREAWLG
ncbi:unnamed protein product [Fusarium graminearum]|uniref:Uncharacterized protein n=1 Tax=Gibberella zeae TaxID=5518 RepID=A0A4E9EFS8_GIBZA|nr:unnamed protein product [Fusarium graminearum]CAF3543022.1 unnamed protein product [Fusarium graminearum]CAG1980044.1 unnamed protein product [Fusarium graminearum]